MLPVAVTMGEPGGVGAEITLAAWSCLRSSAKPFCAITDIGWLREVADGQIPVREVEDPEQVPDVFPDALPVLPEPLVRPARPGQGSPENAAAVIRSIRRAVSRALERRAGAVVTNPVDKAVLREGAQFRHAGHTEFLGELADLREAPVMMLASGTLRVVPVSIHIPLREVPLRLRTEDIVRTGRIADRSLRSDFGIPAPRLAVAGLNPHAGEGGMLGCEEERIVRPAISGLQALGIEASGPHAADSMFRAGFRDTYDAALCMYHDQALIPVKTLEFERSINVTLGLPFVRTSPAHGVAYDLAGTGRANPLSLVEAIRLATRLCAGRMNR